MVVVDDQMKSCKESPPATLFVLCSGTSLVSLITSVFQEAQAVDSCDISIGRAIANCGVLMTACLSLLSGSLKLSFGHVIMSSSVCNWTFCLCVTPGVVGGGWWWWNPEDEKVLGLQVFSKKSVNFFEKNMVFNQNCDFEGWEREREPTNRHTHALMVWEVVGREEEWLFGGFGAEERGEVVVVGGGGGGEEGRKGRINRL